jgi:antitoxin component YwqK of YwqJK toxin-antitoxin module
MKKSLILTILFIGAFSTLSLAKTIVRHYPDGKIQAITHVNKKGVRNGWYKTYWSNGQLQEVGRYKDGKLVGVQRQYSIDGDLLNPSS